METISPEDYGKLKHTSMIEYEQPHAFIHRQGQSWRAVVGYAPRYAHLCPKQYERYFGTEEDARQWCRSHRPSNIQKMSK